MPLTLSLLFFPQIKMIDEPITHEYGTNADCVGTLNDLRMPEHVLAGSFHLNSIFSLESCSLSFCPGKCRMILPRYCESKSIGVRSLMLVNI